MRRSLEAVTLQVAPRPLAAYQCHCGKADSFFPTQPQGRLFLEGHMTDGHPCRSAQVMFARGTEAALQPPHLLEGQIDWFYFHFFSWRNFDPLGGRCCPAHNHCLLGPCLPCLLTAGCPAFPSRLVPAAEGPLQVARTRCPQHGGSRGLPVKLG